jgi:hypothetical protein
VERKLTHAQLESDFQRYTAQVVASRNRRDGTRAALVELVRSQGARFELGGRRALQQDRVEQGWFEDCQADALALLRQGKLDEVMHLLGVELSKPDELNDDHVYGALILAMAENNRWDRLDPLLKALVQSWRESDANRSVMGDFFATVARRNQGGRLQWLVERMANAWLERGPANDEALVAWFSDPQILGEERNRGALGSMLMPAGDEARVQKALGPLKAVFEHVWSLSMEAVAAWGPRMPDSWPLRPSSVFGSPEMTELIQTESWSDPRLPHFFGLGRNTIPDFLRLLDRANLSLEFTGPNGPNNPEQVRSWLYQA